MSNLLTRITTFLIQKALNITASGCDQIGFQLIQNSGSRGRWDCYVKNQTGAPSSAYSLIEGFVEGILTWLRKQRTRRRTPLQNILDFTTETN
jgi:hypothetical protein